MKLSKGQLKALLAPLHPVETNGVDFEAECPECHHREFGISIMENNHPWGCFRGKCGAKGNIYTLRKYGMSFKKEDREINAEIKLEKKTLKVFNNHEKLIFLPPKPLPFGYKRIYSSKYLNDRGFTQKDYGYWEVGQTNLVAKLRDYVVFPIYSCKDIKAYISRLVVEDNFRKRYNNSISEFSSLLGGFDKLPDKIETVIICEGYFDIINITRLLNLYDCEKVRSVCPFGAKISSNQIRLLRDKNIKHIILLFDGDVVPKIKGISFDLNLYFKVQICLLEGNDVDAGNCNLEQLEKALANLYSPLEFNLDKIMKQKMKDRQ